MAGLIEIGDYVVLEVDGTSSALLIELEAMKGKHKEYPWKLISMQTRVRHGQMITEGLMVRR